MNIEELGKELQKLKEMMLDQKQQISAIKDAADATIKEITESHENEEKAVKEIREKAESDRKHLKAKADALMSQSETMTISAQMIESAIAVATESFKLASVRLDAGEVEDALKSIKDGSTVEEAAQLLGIGETQEEEAQEAIAATG